MSIAFVPFDRQRHRDKLRSLTDPELIKTGRTLRFLLADSKLVVSPPGSHEPPWEIQLQDAITEWRGRQRHPMRCLCHLPRSVRSFTPRTPLAIQPSQS